MAQLYLYVNILMLIVVRTNISTLVVDTLNDDCYCCCIENKTTNENHMQFTLPELQSAMNTQTERLGGIDAAIEACDRMYSAKFRGDAVRFGDSGGDDYHRDCLYSEVAKALYAKSTGDYVPVYDTPHWSEIDEEDEAMYENYSDGFGYQMEAYEESAEKWMKDNHPDFKITDDTMVVDFCNYKGEGDDDNLGLYELHKHLPIFKSKAHSFNQVN